MEPPSSSPRFTFTNETSHRLPVSLIRSAASVCLAEHKRDGDIEFVFVDDDRMQSLNRDHRAVDSSTDVLTFAAPQFPHAPLGEVVICIPFAKRQADIRRVTLRTELTYLAIHGVLHLCGFDDENETDRAQMMAEMARIGTLVGLPPEAEWTSVAKADPVRRIA